MKKILKIFGLTIISVILILYITFLFVLPNVVDLNKYKSDVQQIVKEQTNLTLDFDNPKISVTPLLSAGITADNITIKLPDDSELIAAESFKGRIALPSLLLLTVKVSTAEIINPVINIDIIDGKAFKAVSAFEEILNKNEENIEENLQTAQKPVIDPEMIKIIIPAVNIYNYIANINDLKTGNYLKLKGDKLTLGYKNGKTASIKTIAELYLNETKNITANIDIDSFLPAATKLDEEDDKAQRVEIPFINPVAMYMAYDLKTNVDSKIKIRQKNKQIVSKGYFNIDNFTLKLSGIQLPESKFHVTTKGTQVNIDSDLFITDAEKISLLGLFNYSKNPKLDLKLESNEIYIDDVITLIKATLDSLHIRNELQPIKGEGCFITNSHIKTNFKKFESEGNITVKNCIIKNIKNNNILAKINSVISLDNNILKFTDTSVEIAETLFTVDGTIDEKSNTDINVNMEKMPVLKIFTLFLPSEINNAYNVNSGFINLNAKVKGELKNAIADLKLSVNNLSLTDKINKINYLNNILTADFNSNFKSFTGKIDNSDFKLTMNGTTVDCDKFVVTIGEKDIVINPSKIKIDNSTTIDFSGEIKEYIKKPNFNFDASGNLITKDIKKLLGPDFDLYIKEKGTLPLIVKLTGDSTIQTLTASIEADKDNYLTPVDIQNVLGKNTIMQAVIDFKGDRLKIKDTGFYIKSISQDPKNPEKTITNLEEIASIDGTITKLNTTNPNINLIKIKIPNDLQAAICAFPQSKLFANGNMYIFGDLKAPRIRGTFNVWDMVIPELFITMKKAAAKFEGKNLDIDITDLLANDSDYNVLISADLNPSENFVIKNLNLNSNLTDADKLMKVSDAAMKYVPQTASNQQAGAGTAQASIPVIIKDGDINIKQIKTGNIVLTDTTGKISLAKNIFYVNNLITSGFKGKIKGDVSMNLITGEIKALLKGSGLDVEQTLLDAAAMKDTLTGTMDFDCDISLKGTTYEEQMKTLKGNVNFIMKNGQLGPFGKIENLIMAENIRESAFFQSTIGSILNSLLSFDTSHYNELKGTMTFNNGVANINPITTSGDIMGTYIFGNFNLLSNQIDVKLRGRLGSQVSESMGPLALLNPVNLVKATPGMSLVLGKIFFLFCEAVTQDEIDLIPSLGKNISDNNATKFQVIVRGNVEKPLTLIKSFKWLALESEMENAKSYLNTIPQDTLPVDLTNINKEQIEQQVKEKAQTAIKDAASNAISDETKAAIEETKTQIEENKEKANKIKNLFSSKENLKSALQEKAEQAKQEAIKQLEEQQSSAPLEKENQAQ